MESIGPVEPGLDVLLGLLTSGPTCDELAGEDTALEMYRAIQRPAIVTSGPRVPGSIARRHARRRRWLQGWSTGFSIPTSSRRKWERCWVTTWPW